MGGNGNTMDSSVEINGSSEAEPSERTHIGSGRSTSERNYYTRAPGGVRAGRTVSTRVLEDASPKYNWKQFAPTGVLDFFRWLVLGFSSNARLSDEEIKENFRSLACMLMLLREYESRFGMPDGGGPNDQQWVLKQLCARLYASGTPIWVLQPVMAKAAEGLTGARGVEFLLLPRSAFIFAPSSGATTMFRMERGFHMHLATLLERPLVRLASFGTNTQTVHSVQAQLLNPEEFQTPPRRESVFEKTFDCKELAEEILDLASEGTGLFFFTHAKETAYWHESHPDVDDFWQVEDSIRELFTRLAAMEAEESIDALDAQPTTFINQYPWYVILFFRILSSAGATGMWFNGSWEDMIVAGSLAIIVSLAQGATVWKQERIIFEVIISFVVGFAVGLISLTWPERTCFGAMAVGAVIDILQGFRIVYSIMELMSKHTLAGGADFMEAFLFTGLIASFLKFGQFVARAVRKEGQEREDISTECTRPIDEIWYLLILPVTSLAWAVLFLPRRSDLPVMALHGMLAFGVYYGIEKASGESLLSTFVGALCVTLSAGVVSRFSGRQALGDTVTGLYVLVPGAYLARGLFEAAEVNTLNAALLYNIIVNSVVIGLGAWTGTLLCSPTILGTNRGLLAYSKSVRMNKYKRGASNEGKAMLFF